MWLERAISGLVLKCTEHIARALLCVCVCVGQSMAHFTAFVASHDDESPIPLKQGILEPLFDCVGLVQTKEGRSTKDVPIVWRKRAHESPLLADPIIASCLGIRVEFAEREAPEQRVPGCKGEAPLHRGRSLSGAFRRDRFRTVPLRRIFRTPAAQRVDKMNINERPAHAFVNVLC